MPTAQVAIEAVDSALADYRGSDPNLNNQVSSFATAAAVLRWVRIENSGGAEDIHAKLYDQATSPTIGTTAPGLILPCNAGKVTELLSKEGTAFSAGIQGCCVTEPGTAGTTSPAVQVMARVNFT